MSENLFEKYLHEHMATTRYFEEMATIVNDSNEAMSITVNPDTSRVGDPYFKVYNSAKRKKHETAVARCHFKDSGMAFHTGDGYIDWQIDESDVKKIKRLLNKPAKDPFEGHPTKYTIWQMTCYKWNEEYFGGEIDDFSKWVKGDYDEKFKDHPSYVPSTQKIPDTWIFDPPKGKGNRK